MRKFRIYKPMMDLALQEPAIEPKDHHNGDYWELEAEEIGDEYHTMHELYQHRMALTVALTKMIAGVKALTSFSNDIPVVFRSRFHADGTMFDGDYFVVGVIQNDKCHISYHYKMKHWDKFNHCDTLQRAPDYDGFTGQDTIQRLLDL